MDLALWVLLKLIVNAIPERRGRSALLVGCSVFSWLYYRIISSRFGQVHMVRLVYDSSLYFQSLRPPADYRKSQAYPGPCESARAYSRTAKVNNTSAPMWCPFLNPLCRIKRLSAIVIFRSQIVAHPIIAGSLQCNDCLHPLKRVDRVIAVFCKLKCQHKTPAVPNGQILSTIETSGDPFVESCANATLLGKGPPCQSFVTDIRRSRQAYQSAMRSMRGLKLRATCGIRRHWPVDIRCHQPRDVGFPGVADLGQVTQTRLSG
jgi:hypothetical protein